MSVLAFRLMVVWFELFMYLRARPISRSGYKLGSSEANILCNIFNILGEPQSVKIPQFDSNEVVNYEEFPEFTVQVLDQWNQPCSVSDRRTKLHAECEAFVGGPQLANIEHGQGRFPPIKVKLAPGKAPCTVKIKISLVSVDSVRRKITVSEVVRELKQFPIKILPSTLPHKVLICEGNENELAPANGLDKNGRDGRDCLELMAPAGSIVKGLFLKVFDESGRELSAEDFKASEPRITTSWSGEVGKGEITSLVHIV